MAPRKPRKPKSNGNRYEDMPPRVLNCDLENEFWLQMGGQVLNYPPQNSSPEEQKCEANVPGNGQ